MRLHERAQILEVLEKTHGFNRRSFRLVHHRDIVGLVGINPDVGIRSLAVHRVALA
jgi:hypothetical protein